MIKTRIGPRTRLCQGDILRDVEYIEYVAEESGIIEVSKIVFPLVMVLTQDCDLERDYISRWSRKPRSSHDKWLLSVLVAPLYNAAHVFSGQHLTEIGMDMQPINPKRGPGPFLKQNRLPRFHYLEFAEDVPVVASVIDFKHYFSVNVKYLHRIKKSNFVCSISTLFREDVSQRFAGFLSRIGLPPM